MDQEDNDDVYLKQYLGKDAVGMCKSCNKVIKNDEHFVKIPKMEFDGLKTGSLEVTFYHKNGVCDVGQ